MKVSERIANDEGLTLIELMISIGVLGIIMVPLVASFTLALLENTSSRERTADATSAQLISTYLLNDIQSSCVHTTPTDPTKACGDADAGQLFAGQTGMGTVKTNVTGACQTGATAKLELAWRTADTTPKDIVVDYYVATTSDNQLELHRAECADGGAPSDILLALNLEQVSGTSIFNATCQTNDIDVPCTGAPEVITVDVVSKSVRVNSNGSYAPFEFTLQAARRAGT
jgi:prepilin-type N-terminal cleavage/methylation domain-containing protein